MVAYYKNMAYLTNLWIFAYWKMKLTVRKIENWEFCQPSHIHRTDHHKSCFSGQLSDPTVYCFYRISVLKGTYTLVEVSCVADRCDFLSFLERRSGAVTSRLKVLSVLESKSAVSSNFIEPVTQTHQSGENQSESGLSCFVSTLRKSHKNKTV